MKLEVSTDLETTGRANIPWAEAAKQGKAAQGAKNEAVTRSVRAGQ